MALIGNMLNESFAGDPATVNYCMFVSAWSMFTLFYLVPASFNLDWALSPILMVAIDLLNALFFLTAGIALASRLEAHSCSNEVRSFLLPILLTSDPGGKREQIVFRSLDPHRPTC